MMNEKPSPLGYTVEGLLKSCAEFTERVAELEEELAKQKKKTRHVYGGICLSCGRILPTTQPEGEQR